MRIVVAYSKRHFNPETGEKSGSAGEIASRTWSAARNLATSDLVYIDSNLPATWPALDQIDLLITRDVYVPALKFYYKPKQIIVVEVNQATNARVNRMKAVQFLAKREIGSFKNFGNFISKKCAYLIIGNELTQETFREIGVDVRKIRQVSYGIGRISEIQEYHMSRKTILFHIGEISYRKGIDYVQHFISYANHAYPEFKFIVTGFAPAGFESEKILSQVSKELSVTSIPWIDTSSLEFLDILREVVAAILPTREEGLAGAYLDIAKCGIPVFTTRFVGVEIPSTLELAQDENAGMSVDSILEKIAHDSETIWEVAERQRNYVLGMKYSQIEESINNYVKYGFLGPNLIIDGELNGSSIREIRRLFGLTSEFNNSYEGIIFKPAKNELSRSEVKHLHSHVHQTSRMGLKSVYIPNIGEILNYDIALPENAQSIHCKDFSGNPCLPRDVDSRKAKILMSKTKSNFWAHLRSMRVLFKLFLR